MLFVSPHPQYQLLGILQPQDIYHHGTGQYMHTVPGIDAEFTRGAPGWAQDVALAHTPFQQRWGGLPDGTDFRTYVAMFDTDAEARENGWDEDAKDMVEQKLLNHPDFGVRYILATPPSETEEEPWPNYDNTHHSKVSIVAEDIGADIEYVLKYEREHKNRPFVVGKLEEKLTVSEDLVVA